MTRIRYTDTPMAGNSNPGKISGRAARRPATARPRAGAGPPGLPASAGVVAWVVPLALVAATFLAFAPVLSADFVTWDDDRNFLENPHYRGLSGRHLAWMFTTTKMGHYQPLSWMTLGLDYRLWGMNARGYHRTNLLFHCATSLALDFLALRLLALAMPAASRDSPRAARFGAALAALIFALHPLRAESVAWVTERRDVQSGLFFVLAIIAYLRCCTGRHTARLSVGWYLASIGLLVLSLLSKAWGMTIPAVLIILDAYPLRRLGKSPREWFTAATLHVWLQKIPFLLLAGLTAAKAAQAQAGQFETMRTIAQYGFLPRLGQAFYGVGFYLHKTLLPIGLGPIYEIPHHFTGLEGANIVSAAVVLVVTVALILLRRRWPGGLATWAYYVAVVSPVLGLAQSGPQLVKDSYSYLCCMSWGLLAAAALLRVWAPCPHPPTSITSPDLPAGRHGRKGGVRAPSSMSSVGGRILLSVLAASLLVVLGAATWRQCSFWRNSETLWSRALQVQPHSYNANNNLAILLREQGRTAEAIACYRRAIQAQPEEGHAYYNLANALKLLAAAKLGQGDKQGARDYYQQAVRNYELAIERNPLHAAYHFNLANTLTNNLGRGPEALPHFQEALRIKNLPRAPATRVKRSTLHYCIAFELGQLGRLSEARRHLEACLRLDPDHPQANKLKDRWQARPGE